MSRNVRWVLVKFRDQVLVVYSATARDASGADSSGFRVCRADVFSGGVRSEERESETDARACALVDSTRNDVEVDKVDDDDEVMDSGTVSPRRDRGGHSPGPWDGGDLEHLLFGDQDARDSGPRTVPAPGPAFACGLQRLLDREVVEAADIDEAASVVRFAAVAALTAGHDVRPPRRQHPLLVGSPRPIAFDGGRISDAVCVASAPRTDHLLDLFGAASDAPAGAPGPTPTPPCVCGGGLFWLQGCFAVGSGGGGGEPALVYRVAFPLFVSNANDRQPIFVAETEWWFDPQITLGANGRRARGATMARVVFPRMYACGSVSSAGLLDLSHLSGGALLPSTVAAMQNDPVVVDVESTALFSNYSLNDCLGDLVANGIRRRTTSLTSSRSTAYSHSDGGV